VPQNNYDASTFLYLFRKVEQHPNQEYGLLAQGFCREVSSWLGMSPPAMFWFEEADFRHAKQVWLNSPSKNLPTADPLGELCEYFRWSGPPRTIFCAYTHRESPLGIMVNVCRRDEGLLDTIAEECFHFHQDTLHGVGWRARAGDAVEREARAFVDSNKDRIRDFLDRWKHEHEQSPRQVK